MDTIIVKHMELRKFCAKIVGKLTTLDQKLNERYNKV